MKTQTVKKSILVLVVAIVVTAALCPPPLYAETFSIQLTEGKNFISIPLTPQDTSINELLKDESGNTLPYSEVWGFYLEDPGDPWKHYHPAYAGYSDLDKIEHARGYYVFVNSDCTLQLTGTPVTEDITFNLRQGWNVIGWPYLITEDIYDAFWSIDFGEDYTQVSTIARNPATGDETQLNFCNDPAADTLTTFEPGRAYYIYCPREVSVTLSTSLHVKITSPEDGTYTTSQSVTIEGSVSDSSPVATVTVKVTGNGPTTNTPATVERGRFAAYNVALNEGINQIIATLDVGGATAQDTVTLALDTIPPVITAVYDGVAGNDIDVTTSTSELSAHWTAQDSGGIAEYFYGIGTLPLPQQRPDIVGWTSTGFQHFMSHSGLQLVPGQPYYVYVKAIDTAGHVSQLTPSSASDGVTVNDVPSITGIQLPGGKSCYAQESMNIIVNVYDTTADTVSYQFLVIDKFGTEYIIQNWQAAPVTDGLSSYALTWSPVATSIYWGFYDLEVRVRDNYDEAVISSRSPQNPGGVFDIGVYVFVSPVEPPGQ